MAGTPVKRHRGEEESDIQNFDENREAKRYSFNNTTNNKQQQQQALVSFLEQQEDDHDDVVVSSQDLSLFLTNLQKELFSDPLPPCLPDSHGAHQTLLLDPTTEDWNICSKEDDDKESVVIRHLLEASDDELGLPNEVGVDRTVGSGDEDFNGLDGDDNDDKHNSSFLGNQHNSSLFCDGLWELEDEVANYYTLLQSQLFM